MVVDTPGMKNATLHPIKAKANINILLNMKANPPNQVFVWAQKKQEVLQKAAKLKEQRQHSLIYSGERAISHNMSIIATVSF